jgi:inosine/xanthosine triphosphatase
MRVVLGGTFDPLHKGHKALFQRALELGAGDKIIVGLTSDSMAQITRERMVNSFSQRKAKLQKYLDDEIKGFPGKETEIEIIEIDEVFNKPITQDIDADALVVSEGRKKIGIETNELRQNNGLKPLEIVVLPYVLAQDGLPIKATRIHNGEIDEDGKLVGQVVVAVGTNNDVKIRAIENIFQRIFPDVKIIKSPVSSGVPDQPWGDDTIKGAISRAASAFKTVEDAHFGVGVEAGLFQENMTGHCFDVQYCAIVDRGGRITTGHGPGFYYPQVVVDELKKGKTVGEVMAELTNIKEIGHKQGAIGYLSNNLLDRSGLTEPAVLMAMVPRITDIYQK